jgi:hypothetical protein
MADAIESLDGNNDECPIPGTECEDSVQDVEDPEESDSPYINDQNASRESRDSPGLKDLDPSADEPESGSVTPTQASDTAE